MSQTRKKKISELLYWSISTHITPCCHEQKIALLPPLTRTRSNTNDVEDNLRKAVLYTCMKPTMFPYQTYSVLNWLTVVFQMLL